MIEAHIGQTGVERLRQARLGFAGWRRAQLAFGGDAHAVGKPAAKGLEDHGLAGAIHRGGIKERDPAIDRTVERGDRFVCGGFAPSLTDPAAAQREAADRTDRPQRCRLHGYFSSSG